MPIYKICDSNNFLDRLYQGIVTRYKKSEIENLIVVLPNKNPCYYLTKKFFSKIDHGRAVYLPKIISLDEIEDLLVAKQNFLTINTDDQLIVLRVFLKREVQQSLITEQEFHAITYELSNFITKLRVDNKNLLCLQNIFLGTKNNYNKFITQSLKAIAEKWDNFLKSNNLIEAEQLRNELVKNLANDSIKLKNMILAGSTGSIN